MMSSESAMSAIGEGKWEPLSDSALNEWFLLKDELSNKKADNSSSNLTKYEIAEQVLHDIEDLGRNNIDYWLDEFPLFDEIQSQKPNEEPKSKGEQILENFDFVLDQELPSPKNGFAVSDTHKPIPGQQDLFSIADEDIATFILSNESAFYVDDNEPFLSFTPVQQERENCFERNDRTEGTTAFGDSPKESENFHLEASWEGDSGAEDKKEMSEVEEILKNTALELDQWESDTSRSEVSSDGMTSGCSSPKERKEEEEEVEEVEDPDWRPRSLVNEGRKGARRSKPYWRGGSEEERKLRKKEQNKNAATRYRQKKKAEVCEILKEEELLNGKKAKLEERVADIQNEIKYLKTLMRELFRAKGMIK